MPRDYSDCARRLTDLTGARDDRMRTAIDILWDDLAPTGVSWIGFYFIADDESEMILGPRRDKPACSPIGLHGACGQSWRTRKPIVVHDVRALGEGYIACDPRDLSEVVVPLFEKNGDCWGVVDADSYEVGAFSQHDADELARLMKIAGLSSDRNEPRP